ncbi:MAG TPA: hypothetical protein VFP87_12940 [Chitinophagaceae bacterium]|nr:hypothetical protein [Chitinophagaceae bacterium]
MSSATQMILKGSLIALCTISIISSLCKPEVEDYTRNHGHAWEQYDPSYFFKFQNINDIIDSANAQFKLGDRNSLKYYDYIADIVRKRFYHGYSSYSMADNPLIFLAGKYWSNLSAIVLPDDIMKHPMAACSQQAIVLMEIFKRNGTDFRKVTFDHHFTVEARIEKKWRYFDSDMEPKFPRRRKPLNELLATHMFDSVYKYAVANTADFRKELGTARFGKVNQPPASRATFAHRLGLFFVSKYFLFSALLMMIFSSVKISFRNLLKKPLEKLYSPVGVNFTNGNKE